MTDAVHLKQESLDRFFQEHPRAAVAFSGGVDSAYLLFRASVRAKTLLALYVDGGFQPQFELADARRLAEQLKIELTVLEPDIFSCAEAIANGPRRCYYCKRTIFTALWQETRRQGFDLLLILLISFFL